jgi:hypothetical protein
MQGLDAIDEVSRARTAPRRLNAREALMVVTMLYAIASSSEALAADQLSHLSEFGPRDPNPHVAIGLPEKFGANGISAELLQSPQEYSASEFRPRPRFGADPVPLRANDDSQSLRTTTVWQRLKDYRSKDRVRLITLWESTGSSLSIQAGRHGEPSLQWTSSSLNRGGSTRGLLDHFIAASLGAAGLGLQQHNPPRSVGYAASVVPTPLMRRSAIAAATAQIP